MAYYGSNGCGEEEIEMNLIEILAISVVVGLLFCALICFLTANIEFGK